MEASSTDSRRLIAILSICAATVGGCSTIELGPADVTDRRFEPVPLIYVESEDLPVASTTIGTQETTPRPLAGGASQRREDSKLPVSEQAMTSPEGGSSQLA